MLNFRGSVRSTNFFLIVNGYNMDQHLENSWCLVYYQVLGEPGIASCSRQLDVYLGGCGLAHTYSLMMCNSFSLC